jgi:tRNA1Val (adenine37-N6)-methyltransferase
LNLAICDWNLFEICNLLFVKSDSHFHFRQFSVAHDRSAHKVGTDGVLLAAWADVSGVSSILEIGTGSGVIALVLAQRTDEGCRIDAVEVDRESAEQAVENVLRSPWPEKIKVHHNPIQTFNIDRRYDLIISNPPYFVKSSLPPEVKRSNARHTGTLSFAELADAALRLLKPDGKLAVILPVVEAQSFIDIAGLKKMYCIRQCEVQSRKHKPVERILLEFGLKPAQTLVVNLVIHGEKAEWSEEYVRLTGAFYLKL